MRLISFLIIGIISGWIAGELVYGDGFGLLGNLVLGIIGAFVGGFILDFFGRKDSEGDGGLFVSIATSVLGAVVVLFIANLF